MFIRRLKSNSVQKYFNRLLKEVGASAQHGKIQRVGILLHQDEFHDYDAIRKVFKELGFTNNQIAFLTFVSEEGESANSWDITFSAKDFGWKGKILNPEVETFMNKDFDALIAYYNGDYLELNLVTLLSKAKFKIGLSLIEPKLFHLMMDVNVNHVNVFKQELEKYLKPLNKL